jgi:hypothetical protein
LAINLGWGDSKLLKHVMELDRKWPFGIPRRIWKINIKMDFFFLNSFGVLRPLRGDQIKFPLTPSNTQHFLLFYSVVTATTYFGLSSDHENVACWTV